jgi:hypothetical protein
MLPVQGLNLKLQYHFVGLYWRHLGCHLPQHRKFEASAMEILSELASFFRLDRGLRDADHARRP